MKNGIPMMAGRPAKLPVPIVPQVPVLGTGAQVPLPYAGAHQVPVLAEVPVLAPVPGSSPSVVVPAHLKPMLAASPVVLDPYAEAPSPAAAAGPMPAVAPAPASQPSGTAT